MVCSKFEKSEISRITELVFTSISKEEIAKIYSHLKAKGIDHFILWEEENEELIEQFATLPLEEAKKDIRFSNDYWLLLYARWRFILHGVWCYHQMKRFVVPAHSNELQNYLDSRVQFLNIDAFHSSVPFWHPLFEMPSPFLLESGEQFWGFGGYPA